MSRFELSISTNYVSHWGIWEATRELLANSVDQANISPSANTVFHYHDATLTIGNSNTSLPISSLLLGESTKQNCPTTIGQFGEGYKLALIPLLRAGISIEIHNQNQLWIPKFITSRRYGKKILVIDTFKHHRNPDLLFILKGITPAMFTTISDNYLSPDTPLCNTLHVPPYGTVLLHPSFRSKIFAEGLFVCNHVGPIAYGYNLHAPYIELNRDRTTVTTFNLFWSTSKMFAAITNPAHATITANLVFLQMPDVQFLSSHTTLSPNYHTSLCDQTYKQFLTKHGANAVPVFDNHEATLIRRHHNKFTPIVTPETISNLIHQSQTYLSAPSTITIKSHTVEQTPYSIISQVLDDHRDQLHGTPHDIIVEKILKPSSTWKIT